MKQTGKLLLFILLMLVFLPTIALAASSTQDGITVTINTNKTSYNVGETVTITTNVTNSNSFAVNNVKMEVTLPSGLRLNSGNLSTTIGTLVAGETRTLTHLATVAAQNNNNIPKTGDDNFSVLWVGLLLLSIVGAILLIIF